MFGVGRWERDDPCARSLSSHQSKPRICKAAAFHLVLLCNSIRVIFIRAHNVIEAPLSPAELGFRPAGHGGKQITLQEHKRGLGI